MKKYQSIIGMLIIAGIFACALDAGATALTAGAPILSRDGSYLSLTCQSNQHFFAGGLVAVDSGGKAVVASDAASIIICGLAEKELDLTGSHCFDAATIRIRRGIFRLANGGSYTAASIGNFTYVKDDATVWTAASATYDIPVGLIVDVDSAGVWVEISALNRAIGASLTTLAVSGNGTVGGTFDATGNATFGGTATVTGLLRANGGFNTDGGTFSVADTTGNTVVGGTLQVTGAAIFTSTAAASGFKIGSISGYSGIVTNISTIRTNLEFFSGGLVTNVLVNP